LKKKPPKRRIYKKENGPLLLSSDLKLEQAPNYSRILKLLSHIYIYIYINNFKHLLKINYNRIEKCNLSGFYQLQCADCRLKYTGQTGRTFKIRFKEHVRDIRNNGHNSRFAQHRVDTTHEYRTIDQTMEILHIGKKGLALDIHERFHKYEISKRNMQLNDNFTETFNPIYDVIIAAYQT
jgi:hypothetical protein